jgi:hypothetical protein
MLLNQIITVDCDIYMTAINTNFAQNVWAVFIANAGGTHCNRSALMH